MTNADDWLVRLECDAAGLGLGLRGLCPATEADQLPDAYRTIVLLGFVGKSGWQAFSSARREEPHPLDAWSRRQLRTLAGTFGGEAVFPFDAPPYYPFQQWAIRAEGLKPSPIGILMHPEYGLWHSYRGALLLSEPTTVTAPDRDHPCETCLAKPCLSACPVDAVRLETGYDVGGCLEHVESDAGSDCRTAGCQARLACPVGQEHAYDGDQQAFLMHAFIRSFG